MNKVHLISHPVFLKPALKGHAERPERIALALKAFSYERAVNGEKYLLLVHTKAYIDRVKSLSRHAKAGHSLIDSNDTYVVKDTYEAACYAVGAAVQAAEYAKKKQPAFALVRPPGHHAHPDWTNGFCIFNSVAIAAAYLAEKGERVLIVDIDLHRGDGTGDCVGQLNKRSKDHLYYFSINLEGVFPGPSLDEGNVRNVYVKNSTTEEMYIAILRAGLADVVKKFKPTVIAISAGFDTFARDKFDSSIDRAQVEKGLELTAKTVKELKKMIAGHKWFAVLEGGYNPYSVLEGVAAFIDKNVKLPSVKVPAPQQAKPAPKKPLKPEHHIDTSVLKKDIAKLSRVRAKHEKAKKEDVAKALKASLSRLKLRKIMKISEKQAVKPSKKRSKKK